MRVAIIADPLDNQSAGVHVYVRELLRALTTYGSGRHEYILIRSRHADDFPMLEQVVIPNTPWLLGWATLRLFWWVPRTCRSLHVDAVFEPAHFGPFNLPSGIRRITMIHDLTPILLPAMHRWHSQWLQRLFLPRILKNADLIVANSAHTRQDVINYQPAAQHKTVAIPLGVPAAMHHDNDQGVIDRLSLPPQYFLYLGTIEPRKNLLTLLNAFSRYRDEGGTAHLVWGGAMGWKAGPIRKALRSHPYKTAIHLTGFVAEKDKPALYTHALAFIYPSIYEGFGLPVVEAMACGTPVILAKNSSLIEVGGDAALFFPTYDAEALAAQMNRVEQPAIRERYKSLGQARAAQYSWRTHAETFEKALDTLNTQ